MRCAANKSQSEGELRDGDGDVEGGRGGQWMEMGLVWCGLTVVVVVVRTVVVLVALRAAPAMRADRRLDLANIARVGCNERVGGEVVERRGWYYCCRRRAKSKSKSKIPGRHDRETEPSKQL